MADNDVNKGGSSPPKRPAPPKILDAVTVQQKPKIPPLSVRQHLEHLQPLGITKVRWLYQEDKKWVPFNGNDSLKIEKAFR